MTPIELTLVMVLGFVRICYRPIEDIRYAAKIALEVDHSPSMKYKSSSKTGWNSEKSFVQITVPSYPLALSYRPRI